MRKNYILLGLALAIGAYVYELLVNLYENVPFAQALIAVNWGRIIFIGVFGAVVSHFLPDRSSS